LLFHSFAEEDNLNCPLSKKKHLRKEVFAKRKKG